MYQGGLLLHTGALPMSLTFQNKTSPNTPTTVIYRSKKILQGATFVTENTSSVS